MRIFRSGLRILGAGLAVILTLVSPTEAAEPVRIGGTGIALAAMQTIGERVRTVHPELRTTVFASLGSVGGIKGVIEGELDIALSGRDLKPEERAKGVSEAACMTTALIFATSRRESSGITRAQLPGLYSDPAPRWPDGTPLKVILRPRSGSEYPYLIKVFPEMEAPLAAAAKRPGMPVGVTDQENAELAQRTAGSLAIVTLLQLHTEELKLFPVSFDGVAPTADTIASGAYKLPLRVCLLRGANPTPDTERFIAFVRSPEGGALLREFGAHPSD
jgi:phosphate transport system substrate-binding protein